MRGLQRDLLHVRQWNEDRRQHWNEQISRKDNSRFVKIARFENPRCRRSKGDVVRRWKESR